MKAAGRRNLFVAGAIVFAGLAAAPAAEAVTRYADDAGATTGSCTTEATACTLARATSSFGDTTEVIVLPGTYETTATTFVSGIDVHGQQGAAVPVINNTAGGAAIQLYNAGARLADIRVNKTGGSFGAVFQSGNQTLVERVYASTNFSFGVACFTSSGVLRDSTCLATGPDGQGVAASIAGSPDTYTPKVRNVTAVATGSGSEGVAYSSGAVGVGVNADLKSVIAQGVGTDVFAANCNDGSGVTVTLANSNYATTGTSSTGGCQPATITAAGSGTNQTAEPGLVSVAGGDLHQLPGSPTIDAGVADADSGAQDIDLQPRSFDDAPDIGADEFVLGSPAITAVNPGGPANDNQPEVLGTSPVGTTVDLFAASCGGTALASGTPAEFASPGFTVSVADNTVTDLYVRATDTFGNRSACAGPVSYREITPNQDMGQSPNAGGSGTTNPVTPNPVSTKTKCKKAKKGAAGKKKRCGKRKKK